MRQKLQVEKSRCVEGFVNILKYKGEHRQMIKKMWDAQSIRIEELHLRKNPINEDFANKLAQPINSYSVIKLLNDYKTSLVNVAAREIHKSVLLNAVRVQTIHVTHM
jgi:hypothetical protein